MELYELIYQVEKIVQLHFSLKPSIEADAGWEPSFNYFSVLYIRSRGLTSKAESLWAQLVAKFKSV